MAEKLIETCDINILLEIMRRLRDPEKGCPWDLEQDFATIAPYTIEEAYEVADAIDRDDWPGLKAELGDLLLQVVFHAQMADEAGLFDFAGVADGIATKMRRRHPHVFGNESIGSASEQNAAWEAHKQSEREAAGLTGVLDGVARSLPALLRARKLGKRAADVGFDWPDAEGVRAKVDEELRELDDARQGGKPSEIEEEFGDLLFAMANLARHLDIDPEVALRAANDKFVSRFEALESGLEAEGKSWEGETLDTLEARWQEVKRQP